MEPFVVGLGGGLVAEEVAVGARVKERLVTLPAPLAQRQGHGAVGESCLDFPDDGAHPLVREPAVLAALEHEGAEA